MSAILAIDLGGTRCRIGLADAADPARVQLLEDVTAPVDRAGFVELVSGLLAAHGARRLGVGIPGLAHGSICRWVPNLPFLDGLDLAQAFAGVDIGLGNDAQLSLLAEVRAGAAKGCEDAVLLAIGTGIGSAVLASGIIVAGHNGGACSFGWATADMADAGEDTSGWLERQAAGRALDCLGRALGLDGGKALIAAARDGNANALGSLRHPMAALGTAVGSALALLDPAAIIIAGGVAEAFDVLLPILRQEVDRRVPPHLRGVQLVPATHGARAGLVGAAYAGALGANWRRTA
ncbi:ROK family protein [Devosia sp. PTR5]|uniref:ROK family protein n=1 Tax=Devosia oryzisoli TaxID=2774138 RepID=A0A927FW50_9HYPH|nr:ROK family protein [Devosia oryzisoli]MBD8065121.1 ROK family protein [Devosia oryzisoli]